MPGYAELGHRGNGSDVRAFIADAGKLPQLLASGVSHRAAARILRMSEGTVRRAVQRNLALLRSP
jgi:hypothetical protein